MFDITITHTDGGRIQCSEGHCVIEVSFEPYACASGKWAAGRRGRDLRSVLDDSPFRTKYTILRKDWESTGTTSFAVEYLVEMPDNENTDMILDTLRDNETVTDVSSRYRSD